MRIGSTHSPLDVYKRQVLQYCDDESITCKVVDDRKVEFQGEVTYLTSVAKKIMGKENGVCGPHYFRYKSANLWDIDSRK